MKKDRLRIIEGMSGQLINVKRLNWLLGTVGR